MQASGPHETGTGPALQIQIQIQIQILTLSDARGPPRARAALSRGKQKREKTMRRLGDHLPRRPEPTAADPHNPGPQANPAIRLGTGPAPSAMRPVTETLTPSGPPSLPSDPTTTPRPYCPTCDAAGFVYRRLPFGHPHFGRAFPCPACAGDQDENRATLWRLSGIGPNEQVACTFAAFNLAVTPSLRDACHAAQTWADGDGPPFLVLASGDKGIGKTHLAIAAAAVCIDHARAVRYCVVPRLLDDLRDTQQHDATLKLAAVRDPCIRYPVLILDELGRGRPTDWAETELFTIIDDRYREARRTLVITNGDPDTWDDAIRSRLLDRRRSRVVACQGSDYRLRSTTGTARQPLGPTLGVGALPRVPAEDGVERVRGVSA